MHNPLTPPPPPRKGDLLFRDDLQDSQNNAYLNPPWGDEQVGYTEGYRRGARLLVEHIVTRQCDKDFLVYPIIFLYRHHIELVLKNIMMRAPCLLNRPFTAAEEQDLGKHRLDLLWRDLKPIFADICEAAGWSALDQATLEGIDDYIGQLTALDPDSYSARYPRSKKGERLLPPDVKQINLRHFAGTIERLIDYLDTLDQASSAFEEVKSEHMDQS